MYLDSTKREWAESRDNAVQIFDDKTEGESRLMRCRIRSNDGG